ncbi:hypothetical protein ECG_08955 [Echinococcus granulosus]|uniref:Expressed conserved protein n=1 Tax=Echinococcus granulosus TaxID=6210 RepID=A0A068WSJ2_ECHGR|nr:hypothetical protein ECG_08955 [Echinococcus granulosus]CDS21437.1 expressed conserved protein [Echinococcus granulosus]
MDATASVIKAASYFEGTCNSSSTLLLKRRPLCGKSSLQPFLLNMTFNRRSPILVLLLVLHNLFASLAVVLPPSDNKAHGLQSWEDLLPESIDCEEFIDAPECRNHDIIRRRSTECTYTVTLRSKIFPDEELEMCAHPRPSLPCRMNGNVICEVPPMEVSKFDLMILYLINHELQARILRLQNQQEAGRGLSIDLQREIELMIADNVAWMCSRKCNNSSCEFSAELQTHRRTVGSIPRMTSLVTEYPLYARSSRLQHIQIDLPIGSFEISRLLKKKAPFRHLAVSSLPLMVSCLKN